MKRDPMMAEYFAYILLRFGLKPTGDVGELTANLKDQGVITEGEVKMFFPERK